MPDRHDELTADEREESDETNKVFTRRRLLQIGGAGFLGSAFATTRGSAAETNQLEIVASKKSAVDYSFTCTGPIELSQRRGFTAAESDEETVVENDDGTWTATGRAKAGYGDTFTFEDDVVAFQPAEGDYRLYLNGKRISHDDLVQSQETREHWYSFEATGQEYADYYIEVEDGGDMIASTVDDAVIENDYHWINDDGTKAAGRVHPGETHAYEFDTLVADVTIEGQADATVDGKESNLDYYPRDSATGDHWKGYFPWQLEGEEREHWYSFEATGEVYADYYIEVEDGGETIPSLVDDAVIEYEYFWISDDGTKAAGRIDPGETHAYEFDTLVADVTIDGEADATVDGSDSSLDYYPRPGATGDEWKGGFPWQDDDEGYTGSESDGLAMGGGSGYDRIVTQADADVEVETASELADALSSASSGDVVFVPGDAVIDTGSTQFDIPAGVTLASNRGQDGAPGALLTTDDEPEAVIGMEGSDARFTGLRLRGPFPDSDVSYQNGISFHNDTCDGIEVSGANCEIDNNDISGFVYSGVFVSHHGDGGQHIHHNYIHQNNTQGLGYGVVVGDGSDLNPVIEYNYFDENRHSVAATGENYGYVYRYNHIGPTSVMHPIDIHDPGAQDTTIANNIVEPLIRTWDDNCCPAIDGFDSTEGVVQIQDNLFWNDSCTYDVPIDDPNIEVSDNYYGEGTASFADVIPNHPGGSHRPWA